MKVTLDFSFFLIGIVEGGVQLGPLGTTATNRPVVPAPGDYDDREIGGMMIGKGNRSTRRKPAPVQLCPPQTPHAPGFQLVTQEEIATAIFFIYLFSSALPILLNFQFICF
jgi:hypothetical protein